jgi:hypothetical protein
VLVDSTDPNAIAEAIIYLLEHPDAARRMGGERFLGGTTGGDRREIAEDVPVPERFRDGLKIRWELT